MRISQEHFAQAQACDYVPELHPHLAEAALVAGELAEAKAQGQQAHHLVRELSMRSEEGSALHVLGEIACAKGDLSQAEPHLVERLAILEDEPTRF